MRATFPSSGFASMFVVTGLVALVHTRPAYAQTKAGAESAATAKPAAVDAKGSKPDSNAGKTARAAEPEPELEADVASAKASIDALKQTPNKVEVVVTPADPVPATRPSGAPTALLFTVEGAPPPPPEQKGKILMTVGGVFLGFAAVRAGVGGIYGGMALSSKAEFDKNPTVEKADEADRNAILADLWFATAVPAAIVGTVLLLVGATRSDPPEAGGSFQEKVTATLRHGFISPYTMSNGAGAAARFSF